MPRYELDVVMTGNIDCTGASIQGEPLARQPMPISVRVVDGGARTIGCPLLVGDRCTAAHTQIQASCKQLRPSSEAKFTSEEWEGFTENERDVLSLMQRRMGTRRISDHLSMPIGSVRVYRMQVVNGFGVERVLSTISLPEVSQEPIGATIPEEELIRRFGELKNRQREILDILDERPFITAKEIADILETTPQAVRSNLSMAYETLGVSKKTQDRRGVALQVFQRARDLADPPESQQ
jgi:DNA-binding CsgD family transcriptional regulator